MKHSDDVSPHGIVICLSDDFPNVLAQNPTRRQTYAVTICGIAVPKALVPVKLADQARQGFDHGAKSAPAQAHLVFVNPLLVFGNDLSLMLKGHVTKLKHLMFSLDHCQMTSQDS